MKSLIKLLITENTTIREALKVIDDGTMRIAVVINDSKKLLGVINDGDIRRAILDGFDLNAPIREVYNKKPIYCSKKDSLEIIIKTAIKYKVYQIPIIDENHNLVDIEDLATLLMGVSKKNKVILMAGGLGTRLKPLTDGTPKPLLNVGTKPILQTIVENFVSFGFKDIIISVNYKADMIKNYFQDGKNFGANISYLEESKRLGTAGALSLIKEKIDKPFFVMNADLLTNVNFENLLNFHIEANSIATMCVREYDFQVPYGVIKTKNDKITSIEEKPIQKFFVNSGIYVLSPSILKNIPEDTFYDMPTLFNELIKEQKNVISFPIHEYWLDIGHIEDFQKAQLEYEHIYKD